VISGLPPAGGFRKQGELKMIGRPTLPTRFDEQRWYAGPGEMVCTVIKYYQGHYGIYIKGEDEYRSGNAKVIRKTLDYFMANGKLLH
jgi:hypothetical protein